MTTRVQLIAEQFKALADDERAELLTWLADFELASDDAWDIEIAKDSQPGGRLSNLLERARRDIAEGRTKPLNEILDDV